MFGDEDFFANPHGYWRRRRGDGGVVYEEQLQAWLVLRDDPAREALRSSDLGLDVYSRLRPSPVPLPSSFELPDARNTEFRTLVGTALAGDGLRLDRVDDVCRDHAGRLAGSEIDLVADHALPLSERLLTDWLGVRREDCDYVLQLLAIADGTDDPVRRKAAGELFVEWLSGEIEARRRAPREDLLTPLAVRWAEAGADDDDLVAFIAPMIFSLVQRNGLTLAVNTAWGLGTSGRAPGLPACRAAAYEAARWEPVNPVAPRVVTTDTQLGGVPLQAGQRVLVVMPAACRDPGVHADPDEFRPGRARRHVAFGVGSHACLGRNLSLEVAARSLHRLTEEWGAWRVSGQPETEASFGLRCLNLPITRVARGGD